MFLLLMLPDFIIAGSLQRAKTKAHAHTARANCEVAPATGDISLVTNKLLVPTHRR